MKGTKLTLKNAPTVYDRLQKALNGITYVKSRYAYVKTAKETLRIIKKYTTWFPVYMKDEVILSTQMGCENSEVVYNNRDGLNYLFPIKIGSAKRYYDLISPGDTVFIMPSAIIVRTKHPAYFGNRNPKAFLVITW